MTVQDLARTSASEMASFFEGLTPLIFGAKMIGSVAGSVISLAYILPRGRREAALRLAVGIITGLVFGTTVGLKMAQTLGVLERLTVFETTLIGSTLASLCAWWAIGLLHRIHERWNPLPGLATVPPKSVRRSKP
ncbi:MAG: DUF6107 family protein [Pseudomonadota bacterium]